MKNLLISLVLSVALLISCNNGTEPSSPANPRSLNWTADSLYFPESVQTKMEKLWASSSNDVYAIGHCSASRGQLSIMMAVPGLLTHYLIPGIRN